MPIMWPHEAAFLRLQGKPSPVYRNMTKEGAYEFLKKHTGQDFGYDVAAWQQWFDNDPEFSQMKPYLSDRYQSNMDAGEHPTDNETDV